MASDLHFTTGSVQWVAPHPASPCSSRPASCRGWAGRLFPVTLALLNATFAEGAARNRALTVRSAAGAGGGAVGALLGGLLTSSLGWRSTFFVVVPFVVVPFAVAVGLLALPALGPGPGRPRPSTPSCR